MKLTDIYTFKRHKLANIGDDEEVIIEGQSNSLIIKRKKYTNPPHSIAVVLIKNGDENADKGEVIIEIQEKLNPSRS